MIEPPLPISGSAFWNVKIVPFTLVSKVSSGLSCAVITALGDKFDFLAYYSDFRIDNQEASTPSDGPVGGNVKGIGNTEHDQTQQLLDSRCTQGRFQLGFAQPVYVGSNEAQERPPEGAPVGSSHDITFY